MSRGSRRCSRITAAGVRGDLRAVVRAILLDVEARSAAIAGDADLRQAARADQPADRLGARVQRRPRRPAPGRRSATPARPRTGSARARAAAPSVFNFFRPGYTPPNTAIATAGLVAPEFQITNEPSVIAYVNYMGEPGPVERAISAPIMPTWSRSPATARRWSTRSTSCSARGSPTRPRRRSAARSTRSRRPATNGPNNRVYTAVLLTLASPEFLVQK